MALAEDVKEYLLRKYTDLNSPGAYTGVDKFYRVIRRDKRHKITRKQVKEFLQSQEFYTLMRQVNKKFTRNRVIVPYEGYQVDIDTAFFRDYAKHNSNFKYVIAGIDCFSKLAHTVPVKSLKPAEFVPALEKLLKKFKRIERCRSDPGSEFKNKQTEALFKRLKIKHFFTNNTETKSSIVERFFRTLKRRLYLYLTANNTHKWIDALEKITDAYNNSYHRSIGQSPASYTEKDEFDVWKRLYETEMPKEPQTNFNFKLHDTVRISTLNNVFARDIDESCLVKSF